MNTYTCENTLSRTRQRHRSEKARPRSFDAFRGMSYFYLLSTCPLISPFRHFSLFPYSLVVSRCPPDARFNLNIMQTGHIRSTMTKGEYSSRANSRHSTLAPASHGELLRSCLSPVSDLYKLTIFAYNLKTKLFT